MRLFPRTSTDLAFKTGSWAYSTLADGNNSPAAMTTRSACQRLPRASVGAVLLSVTAVLLFGPTGVHSWKPTPRHQSPRGKCIGWPSIHPDGQSLDLAHPLTAQR